MEIIKNVYTGQKPVRPNTTHFGTEQTTLGWSAQIVLKRPFAAYVSFLFLSAVLVEDSPSILDISVIEIGNDDNIDSVFLRKCLKYSNFRLLFIDL